MYKLNINLETISSKNFKSVERVIKKLKRFKFFKGINIKLINMPLNKKKLITVLKSPHVHKKSREQFKYQTYKKKILIENSNIIKLLYLEIFLKKLLNKGFKISSKICNY